MLDLLIFAKVASADIVSLVRSNLTREVTIFVQLVKKTVQEFPGLDRQGADVAL
jgi:hypothetical protein